MELNKPLITGSKNALKIGKAAEHIVCSDLLMQGYEAYLSDQGLPYDIVVDIDGRLLRVQVKGNVHPRNMNCKGKKERIGYSFSARRNGKGGVSRLKNSDCDIMAFVAIDIGIVAYMPVEQSTITVQFSPPKFVFEGVKRGNVKNIDQFPFSEALQKTLARTGDVFGNEVNKYKGDKS